MFKPKNFTPAPRKSPTTAYSPKPSPLSNAVSTALTGATPDIVATSTGTSPSIVASGAPAITETGFVSALAEGLNQGAQLISQDVADITSVVTKTASQLFASDAADGKLKWPTKDNLVSTLAEGLNEGAALISEDVAKITQTTTEALSKILSPKLEMPQVGLSGGFIKPGLQREGQPGMDAVKYPPSGLQGPASMPQVGQPGGGFVKPGLQREGQPGMGAVKYPPSDFQGPTSQPDVDDHFHTGRAITQFVAPSANYAPPQLKLPEDTSLIKFARTTLNATQARLDDRDRLLRFYAPLPEDKRLYVTSLHGQASLSDLDTYTLRLLSTNASIDLQEVLGKNVTTAIRLNNGQEHPINGYVTAFGFTGTDGGLASYQAEVTPWLWYLTKRVNSRIYQDMNVLDVIAQVFADYGALVDYQVHIAQSPPVDSYIVQYHETDFHFISRLLEKYGLFYYFEHRHDGHTLVICDDSLSTDCCPPQSMHAQVPFNDGERVDQQDCVTHIATQRTVQIGAVALNTYDYKKPSVIPYLEQPTVAVQGDIPVLEVYNGNPAFAYRSFDEGNREAKRLLEAHEWQAKQFFAKSECRGMCVGRTFQLLRHFWFDPSDPDSADFLVIGLQIEASNNFERAAGDDLYCNRLTLIRRKIPYRPTPSHDKPSMRGPQSATVVGPAGQEIYTDAMGRIKVQFPWDRHGKFDERSSCWIRVSQPWAGRNWGTIAVPRIGQEVIVDFFEGDPDRPIITGRLYNGEQTAPYALPDGAHMMGFHSNSTPGGGGYSEMVIHDQKGKELINIRSQKNMKTTVLNDQDITVNNNQTVTVMNDQVTKVKSNQTIEVSGCQITTVWGPAQLNSVKEGAQLNTVQKSISTHSFDGSIYTVAHNDAEVYAGTGHILIEGKTFIRLKVGASSLEMHADGTIRLNGKLVQIVGTDSVDLNP